MTPADLRFVTPAYYCNFIKLVSSAKCVLFPLKKEQNNYTVNEFCFAFFALLYLFFTSNSVVFVAEGAKECFLPQGAGYPR